MIAICIVNYNTCEHLRACLAALQAEEVAEVVVVDNNSTDTSASMVREEFPWVTLLANQANPGYGSAANQAIASCNAEYILLLNSDTRLYADALQALIVYLDQHPDTGIVGPRLVNLNGSLQPSCYYFPTPLHVFLGESSLERLIGRLPILRNRYLRTWPHDRSRAVPWVLGAALAIRRTAFNEVGGFDDSFYMYAEEIDLSYRMYLNGWQTHFSPDATIQHIGGASTNQRRVEMAAQFYDSLMHFYQCHYSYRLQTRLKWVMKMIVRARIIRETIRVHFPSHNGGYTRIRENLETWQNMLSHIQAEELAQG